MGIIKRQSIKGLAVYIIGAFIHVFTMLYYMPNFIADADVGVFRVCLSLILIFSSLGTLGVTALLIKSHQEFTANKKLVGSFNFVTFLIALIGAIISFIILHACKTGIYAWKGNSDAYLLRHFYTIPLGVFFSVMLFYFDAYSVATFRLTAPSIVKEIIVKLSILIAAILFAKQIISADTFFLIFVLTYAFGFLILAIYGYFFRNYRWHINLDILKDVHFRHQFYPTLFILIIGVLGSLMLTINEPLMYHLLGATQTKIQSVAITLSSMLTIPYKPLSNILFPFMHDAWQKKDLEKLKKISLDSSKYLYAIGILLFLLLWCNIDLILNLIPNMATALYWPLLVFCIGRLIDYTTGTSTELIYTAPTYKVIVPQMLIVFIVSVIGYVLLIPKLQVLGAAITFSGMLTLFNILKYIHLRKKYKFEFFSSSMLYITIIAVVIFVIQYYLPQLHSNWILAIILKSGIVGSLFIALVYFANVFPELNIVIKNKLPFSKNK